jgi:23S rRNA G2445 N2-methylase RlmL
VRTRYEAETAPGLADITELELREQFGADITIHQRRDDAVVFTYTNAPADLLNISTVIAVYALHTFKIPRPKALLGHQNFHRLLDAIDDVRSICGHDDFQTLHLSAAGSGSSVMQRIKDNLAEHTGLTIDLTEGDLLLRLRPTPGKKRHWDALIRLTPRPLATRDWRVCNLPGALNASVAHAMIRLSRPRPSDVVVNLACGSGTLLIERAARMSAGALMGLDIDRNALHCARENVAAAEYPSIQLIEADATQTPLAAGSVDCLYADLPFGQLVGSHEQNLQLYPALLSEAARIARPGARFVLITHEVTLMNSVLAGMSDAWQINEKRRITLSGLHPRIFVLERV